MKHRSVRVALLCLVAVAVLALAAAPAQAKRSVNPRVFPPQARPFGLSYGDWANRYYQWLAVIPTAENPLTDPTGARAAVGQTGKVWFLTTTNDWQDVEGGVYSSAERSITVPNGKGLFVPLNLWWQNIPIGHPEVSEADLRAGAEWGIAHVTGLSATVDGRQLRGLFAYKIISPLFDMWWIEDNVIFIGNDPEGDPADWADNPTPTVISGFGLILAPLSVGHHEIKWRYESTYTEAEDGFDFEGDQDVIYHVTVVPR
jgi:hypothetical protein